MRSLADLLEAHTTEGEIWESIDRDRIRCYACGHECPIPTGAQGVCRVRFNRNGRLQVPWGYVGGTQCDPVEKQPFFHLYPGALAYSFGLLGCDLHCDYCQNWVTSQALRDPSATAPPRPTTPRALVDDAVRSGARLVVSTYNEPLITGEWAVAVFKAAREAGLTTGFVSNGNATPRALEYLRPWLEVVTLLIPGFNDSDDEVRRLTEFLAGVSPDIPWHVTAFHRDYRMNDTSDTAPASLVRAAGIGRESGLQFVYAGNRPGQVGSLEHTGCPTCGMAVVERCGYEVGAYRLTSDGRGDA